MATQHLSENPKLAESGERAGSIGMVLLVAFGLIGAAAAVLLVGRNNAQPYILALLSALAVIGVFSLFAGAAGILRLPGRGHRHGANDVLLDDDVARAADHQQMLDVVAADQEQPAPAINRGCIDHGEPGLAPTRSRGSEIRCAETPCQPCE